MKLVIRPAFTAEKFDFVVDRDNDHDVATGIRTALAMSPTSEAVIQESEDGKFTDHD